MLINIKIDFFIKIFVVHDLLVCIFHPKFRLLYKCIIIV